MVPLLMLAVLAAATPTCSYSRAILDLPPDRFDQDPKGGWRPLADRPGCEAAAADLLAAYRKRHWGRLKPSDLHINYWHEGQMRASAGDNARAIPLLLAGVSPDDVADFADYALGTVAFLNNDKAGLLAARARLASLPEPAWFKTDRLAPSRMIQVKPRWPMNLDVLDQLNSCFGQPYRLASSGACRSSEKAAPRPSPQ